MAPVENGVGAFSGDYLVVTWDLDSTGRRLTDDICHIGCYSLSDETTEEQTFSQYVMPFKNPNPGARKFFGIEVVRIGRYRLLKEMKSGNILKTKSEVFALQVFIHWLQKIKEKTNKDGVLLVCHEPTRTVLIPLLLEALNRYNLLPNFNRVVAGFVNAALVAEKLGDKSIITSYSLRSLCKTVLMDTNPNTTNALARSKVIVQILAKLAPGTNSGAVDNKKLAEFATPVSEEENKLNQLKHVLQTQGTLRPIFESHFRKRRSVRERAIALRKLVAESGLDYPTLASMFSSHVQESEAMKVTIKEKITSDISDADIDELMSLFKAHFNPWQATSDNGEPGSENVFEHIFYIENSD